MRVIFFFENYSAFTIFVTSDVFRSVIFLCVLRLLVTLNTRQANNSV